MIYRPDEMDMTSHEAIVEAVRLSEEKETVLEELLEVQRSLTQALGSLRSLSEISGEDPETRTDEDIRTKPDTPDEDLAGTETEASAHAGHAGRGRAAGGTNSMKTAFSKYFDEHFHTDSRERAEAARAALVLLMFKCSEDNREQLGLDIPRRMQFSALSMLLPDRIRAEELRTRAHEVYGLVRKRNEPEPGSGLSESKVGSEEAMGVSGESLDRILLYCTNPKHEAILINVMHIIGENELADEAARRQMLETGEYLGTLAAVADDDFPEEAFDDFFVDALRGLCEKLGDRLAGKTADEKAANERSANGGSADTNAADKKDRGSQNGSRMNSAEGDPYARRRETAAGSAAEQPDAASEIRYLLERKRRLIREFDELDTILTRHIEKGLNRDPA